jgi:hypothetical protein
MKRAQLLKHVMKSLNDEVEVGGSSSIKILIDKGLKISKEDQRLIRDYCSMCCRALGIEGDYKCFLSANRKRSHIITTATCSFSDESIKIYCHERAMADILRSIAHEMFHLRQHELDLIPRGIKKPHHLNPIEWHANVAGGSLLSYFASKVGKDKIYR